MSIHQTRKAAEEMSIPFKQAAWCRIRFLRAEVKRLSADVVWFCDYADSADQVNAGVAVHFAWQAFNELIKAAKELRQLSLAVNGHQLPKGRITDEQIEAAKAVPVDTLVEFVRGRALAWCHPDRNPSLYHGTRKNVAVCPVCDLKFGPIDILVKRDGMTFIDAVKQLAEDL